MKIAFTGYYGFSNYGDDLFAVVCSWAARKYWPEHRSSVIGPPVKGAEAHFRVPSFFPGSWYSGTGLTGKLSRLSAMTCAALGSDLIVLAGGSMLSSRGSSNMRDMQHFASRLGLVKLGGIGLSLGPFDSSADERQCAEFLKRFAYLAVRDDASYESAMSMDLHCDVVRSRDLAGLLPMAAPLENMPMDGERPLGVALCNYESYVGGDIRVEQRRNEALFTALREFAASRKTAVRIFSLNSHPVMGDDDLSASLASHLDAAGIENRIVSAGVGTVETWREIARCSAMISVRLHGGISAYLAGVPFCLVEYHKKCEDFLEDVGQDPSLRLAGDVDSPHSIRAVLECMVNDPPKPELLPSIYTEESKRNFTAAPWSAEQGIVAEGIVLGSN